MARSKKGEKFIISKRYESQSSLYYSVKIDSDDSIFNIDMNTHTSDDVDNNGNYMHIKNEEEMKNHHRCIFEPY
jgi:hypothetical protein